MWLNAFRIILILGCGFMAWVAQCLVIEFVDRIDIARRQPSNSKSEIKERIGLFVDLIELGENTHIVSHPTPIYETCVSGFQLKTVWNND